MAYSSLDVYKDCGILTVSEADMHNRRPTNAASKTSVPHPDADD